MTNHRSLMTTTALSGAMAVSTLVAGAGAAQAASATFHGGTNVVIATQSLNSAGTVSLSQADQTLVVQLTGAETCAVGTTITLTAPSGVTFSAVPNSAVSGPGGGTAATLSGALATGNSSVVYTVAGNALNSANYGTITFGGTTNPFFLTTGSTLATNTGNNARVFTVSSTCSSFAVPTVASGLTSTSGFNATLTGSASLTVDTTAAGAGRLFTTGAASTTRVATLRTIMIGNTVTAVDASNGSTYLLPSGVSTTTTLTGSFAAASRVYAVTNACVTTPGGSLPSGSVIGSITGSSAVLTGMVLNTTYTLCYENNGSTMIQAGAGIDAPITGAATVSNMAGAHTGFTVGTLRYSGAAATINYVTGGAAYQYFVRVTNPNAFATSVFAVVIREDGTSASGSLNTALGANANALYSIADINTATGANLTASDRASIQVLTSQTAASVTGILLNTATGVVMPAQGSAPPPG